MTESREQVSQSPRDNVLFECGLFIGKIGRNRTFIVYDSEKEIKIPSDLAGVSMATFNGTRKDGNLKAAVGEACDLIRDAIKSQTALDTDEQVIYDSRTRLNIHDFYDRENATSFDNNGKPIAPIGRGILSFDDNGILHVKRTNVEGRFEVHLQHNGPGKPIIFKKEVIERNLRVRFQAKIEDGSEHTLRLVFKDETANKLTDYRVTVRKYTDKYKWDEIDVPFRVSPMVDLTFRIDDEVKSQTPGNINNIVITEEPI